MCRSSEKNDIFIQKFVVSGFKKKEKKEKKFPQIVLIVINN